MNASYKSAGAPCGAKFEGGCRGTAHPVHPLVVNFSARDHSDPRVASYAGVVVCGPCADFLRAAGAQIVHAHRCTAKGGCGRWTAGSICEEHFLAGLQCRYEGVRREALDLLNGLNGSGKFPRRILAEAADAAAKGDLRLAVRLAERATRIAGEAARPTQLGAIAQVQIGLKADRRFVEGRRLDIKSTAHIYAHKLTPVPASVAAKAELDGALALAEASHSHAPGAIFTRPGLCSFCGRHGHDRATCPDKGGPRGKSKAAEGGKNKNGRK